MKSVIDFVKANNSKVTVVGTSNVISDDMYSKLGAVERVDGGANRFETNLNVLNKFASDLKADKVFVANASGNGFADALVASALAGKTASPLVLVDTEGVTATTNAVNYIKTVATKTSDLNVIGGTGAVSTGIENDINNIFNPQPSNGGTALPGQAVVSSVTAASATTFQVKFAQAPADTSKVAFNVTREGTPVTLTTSWDSTNTIATLSYSSNLPEDTYAVDVKDGDNDLGSTNASITSQKIAKIEVTSTTLGVSSPSTTSTNDAIGGNGYATYKVLDQYGNDITTGGIAQGITWTCGVGTVTAQNGLLTVTPFNGSTNFLTQYTSATINGVDQTTGVTTSANLTVTQNQGTLGDIKLNKLTCSNDANAIFAAGDTTDSFYIDFTATDLSGNTTNNYDLIRHGLMNNNGTVEGLGLISSNPTAVDVKLVTDPNNSTNALIQVTPKDASTIVADQPVVITAFTTNGKSGSITLNLHKSAQVETFTLMAPSTTVSAGDKGIIIPFTAVDQNGKALTKYSDIVGSTSQPNVTISGSFSGSQLRFVNNPDGTAGLQLDLDDNAVQSPLTSQSYTVQSVVRNTGKFSSLNIVVQAKAKPDTLNVTTKVAVPNLQKGAVENLDFGYNFADLAVKDQYGRAMDMTNQDTVTPGATWYSIVASATSGSTVTINPNANEAYGHKNIQLIAGNTSGSTTVTYKVMKHINADSANGVAASVAQLTTLNPITQQYTVVSDTDIKDYSIDKIPTLYDAAGNNNYGATVTNANPSVASATNADGTTKQSYIGKANLGKFYTDAYVYGLTSGGGKVALPSSAIISASVDNSSDFVADLGDNYSDVAQVGVYAKNTLSSTKPTATGNVSVVIKGQDGVTHSATTAVTSKDDTPVAATVGFDTKKAYSTDASGAGNVFDTHGYAMNISGNNITMSATDFNKGMVGKLITRYNPTGTENVRKTVGAIVSLVAKDQYGTPTAPFTTLTATSTNTAYTVSIDSNNHLQLTGGAVAAGDIITLTGVTANGLVESVNVGINSSSIDSQAIDSATTTPTTTDTTAPVITLNGNATVNVVTGATYTESGATATDAVDGTVAVTTTGTVDTTKAGTYTVTYTATDKAGNKATATRTVVVAATTVAADLTTLTLDTTTLPFTTIATFKLNVPTGDSAANYTVTVKGKAAQYNSTTGMFGAAVDGTLKTTDFAATDFVVTHN
jgi:hypothetical protein